MFCISWKYDMVVYDECIAFLILGNIGWCIYLTEIFAELYRWWQRMIENDFPKLVNRIQKSSELILKEGGSQYVSQVQLSEDEFTHSTPFSHINNTFAMMIWIDVYTQPKNMVTELLGQKKVVPKILRPRTYWHQQFETSTGDKTHTDHILPGGETFVLTRWEIKQIFRKPETNIKQIFSTNETKIMSVLNKYQTNVKQKANKYRTYLRRNLLSPAAP